jgi:hypothetical protein
MFWCFFDLKNVFPTVKILTFSRGKLKFVQMDQGLSISSFQNSVLFTIGNIFCRKIYNKILNMSPSIEKYIFSFLYSVHYASNEISCEISITHPFNLNRCTMLPNRSNFPHAGFTLTHQSNRFKRFARQTIIEIRISIY